MAQKLEEVAVARDDHIDLYSQGGCDDVIVVGVIGDHALGRDQRGEIGDVETIGEYLAGSAVNGCKTFRRYWSDQNLGKLFC